MEQKKYGWKVFAIILLIIIILENIVIGWGIYRLNEEEDKTNICYYDICREYSEAYYLNKICTCYEPDLLGNLQIAKETYLK